MQNAIKDILFSLGLTKEENIYEYFPTSRDRNDVSVLRCKESGVVFLDRTDHISNKHYENYTDYSYWANGGRTEAVNKAYTDDYRRAQQFFSLINHKVWLDFGTGAGGILDLLGKEAKKTYAIELQRSCCEKLKELEYAVFSNIEEIPTSNLDVITLFHVFEHLVHPIETLKILRTKMSNKSKLIIEVPHANDALLTQYNCEAFKKFTFWSEHLILHTKESLKLFIENAGFRNVEVLGFQRYPLSNHFYWLANGKPGGHEKWAQLNSSEVEKAYSNLLNKLNMTDTLIAIASK